MTGFETVMMWVIAPVIAALAGGWGGWIFGRKKQRIDEIDAATGTFNKIIEQLRKEVEVLIAEHAHSKELIDQLRNEIETLINERGHNRAVIEKQSKQIEELATEVRKLSAEVESLRADKKENVKLKNKIEKYEKLLDANNVDY